MQEPTAPHTGQAQGRAEKPFPYFLLAGLLAAGICAAVFLAGKAPAPGAVPAPAAAPAAAVPQAAEMKPLARSLDGITTRYKKMKPGLIEPILSGPLQGGTVRKYVTGSATDDLTTFNGAVYRRSMSFRLAEMVESVEGTHANFSGLVFIYALYPSAFDKEITGENVPPEVKKLADAYGAACGALAEPGAPPAEHRETHDGYIFSCSNKDTTRLIYGVCSEGLPAAEAAAGK